MNGVCEQHEFECRMADAGTPTVCSVYGEIPAYDEKEAARRAANCIQGWIRITGPDDGYESMDEE